VDYVFILKKLFWMIFPPLNLTMILLLGGIWMQQRRIGGGRVTVNIAILLFVICGVAPTGQFLMERLEQRYDEPRLPRDVSGILVLGGAFDVNLSGARGMPTVYGSGERVMEAIRLMRIYPETPLIYSGGNGLLDSTAPPETLVFRDYLARLGVNDANVRYESKSRDTYENVRYSRVLAKPDKDSVWILVTSASHMPRAMALMKKNWAGKVIAYPVDYQTPGTGDLTFNLDILGNYAAMHNAMREYLALLFYRIGGKIDSLL
jgi:uncharacterized SAM-binding protein YcdF (DUF218 family)